MVYGSPLKVTEIGMSLTPIANISISFSITSCGGLVSLLFTSFRALSSSVSIGVVVSCVSGILILLNWIGDDFMLL